MAENKFTVTAESLFNGMNTFVSTKTVVGEPQRVGDAIIIPLVDVSCGMAVGSFAGNAKDNGAGGIGAKMSPAAVLLIAKDGTTKLISMKDEDAVSKIIDMAPDIITKIRNAVGGEGDEAESDTTEFEE